MQRYMVTFIRNDEYMFLLDLEEAKKEVRLAIGPITWAQRRYFFKPWAFYFIAFHGSARVAYIEEVQLDYEAP